MSSLPSSCKFQSKSYENKHIIQNLFITSEKFKKVDKWCVNHTERSYNETL